MLWFLKILCRIDTQNVALYSNECIRAGYILTISKVKILYVWSQAARLSYECRRTQSVGHELCVRPFLHQDTPHEEISAVLLYAATLQLRAKLFCHPVAGKYVCLALTLALVALFALGMCHYLQWFKDHLIRFKLSCNYN